jgi:hypothetical protein
MKHDGDWPCIRMTLHFFAFDESPIKAEGLFRWGNFLGSSYCSIFRFIWQFMSNHGLIRLKRFVS